MKQAALNSSGASSKSCDYTFKSLNFAFGNFLPSPLSVSYFSVFAQFQAPDALEMLPRFALDVLHSFPPPTPVLFHPFVNGLSYWGCYCFEEQTCRACKCDRLNAVFLAWGPARNPTVSSPT